jgi:hypothetical protein
MPKDFYKNLVFSSIFNKMNENKLNPDSGIVLPEFDTPLTIYRTQDNNDEINIYLWKSTDDWPGAEDILETSGLYYRYGTSGAWIKLADESGELYPVILNETNGNIVQFRNTNNEFSLNDMDHYFYFYFSGGVGVSGNIQSLMNFSSEVQSYCFYRLFAGSTLTEAHSLILPVKKMEPCCYSSMFSNCTSLTVAPELPATALASECYSSMFSGCYNLLTGPSELPAERLVSYCYKFMFESCESLTRSPEIFGTNFVGDEGLYGMFYSCSELTYISVRFTEWDPDDTDFTDDWVYGVSSNGTFICPLELPEEYGNSYIPKNWKVLISGGSY